MLLWRLWLYSNSLVGACIMRVRETQRRSTVKRDKLLVEIDSVSGNVLVGANKLVVDRKPFVSRPRCCKFHSCWLRIQKELKNKPIIRVTTKHRCYVLRPRSVVETKEYSFILLYWCYRASNPKKKELTSDIVEVLGLSQANDINRLTRRHGETLLGHVLHQVHALKRHPFTLLTPFLRETTPVINQTANCIVFQNALF